MSQHGMTGGPAAPLVAFEHVTAAYGTAAPVFTDLSLTLDKRRHLALLGPNGVGKSTFMRLIQGELRPSQNTPGRIIWDFGSGPETSALAAREQVRTVSPAQQSTYVRRGWNITGEEIILSGLDNAAMIYGELAAHHYATAGKLAEAASASHLLERALPTLSQGQLRLLLILRAVISRPALLLLDEPFDGLDPAARADVVRSIGLAAEQGCTILVSAHRKEDIPPFIDNALEFSHYGIALRALADISGEAAQPEPLAGIALRTGIPSPVQSCAAPVLSVRDMDVFIDRKQVLFDINWTIRQGEHWIVSGPNGSGKSTLLRLLYGDEYAAYGGTLEWFGKQRAPLEEFRTTVGYVADRLQDTWEYDLTAEEVVVSGLYGSIGLYADPSDGEKHNAHTLLQQMRLEHTIGTPFSSLSSGTARRVLLARALIAAPKALLLDEPCSGLDPASRAAFLNSLAEPALRGMTVILVSHHENDRHPLFTHELRLADGKAVYAGPKA